jgi:photosystem II stability/assembly factor-like uncharacterized protein
VQLDVTQAGARLVAVGERGVILVSDDQGAHWRQTPSPTSVTLTAVRFADERHGWALGHFGTVLRTDDGGLSWQRQLDGIRAAAFALKAAEESRGGDPERARKAVGDAQRLVADGPDKPFFDALFTDSQHGWIVGAYNLCFFTKDGGASWQPMLNRLDNPRGNHLYAIRSDPRDAGRTLYIAGEAGVLFRSDDAGQTFSRLTSPYAGSWFALAVADDGSVVAAGLRGNAFRSTDKGNTWAAIAGLPPVSIVSARTSPDGRLWLGNQAGQVFVGKADAGPLQPWAGPPGPPPPPLNALLPLDDHRVALATVAGVQVVRGQVSNKP